MLCTRVCLLRDNLGWLVRACNCLLKRNKIKDIIFPDGSSLLQGSGHGEGEKAKLTLHRRHSMDWFLLRTLLILLYFTKNVSNVHVDNCSNKLSHRDIHYAAYVVERRHPLVKVLLNLPCN